MSPPTAVHVAEIGDIAVADALERAAAAMSTAALMLADPAQFVLARFDERGRPRGRDGAEASLQRVFEARAFDGRYELLWVRAGDSGRAAVVGEQPWDGDATAEVAVLGHVDRTELAWGGISRTAHGWTWTHEARVGELALPATVDEHARAVALRLREYLVDGGDDVDGNAMVGHERIIGFEGVR